VKYPPFILGLGMQLIVRTFAIEWKRTISKMSMLMCLLVILLPAYSQTIKSGSSEQPKKADPAKSKSQRKRLPAALRKSRWTLPASLSFIYSLKHTKSPSSLNAADDIDLLRTTSPSLSVVSSGPTAPPRLKGSVEMRNGQLVIVLTNLDNQRTFNGIARVTLNEGKNERDSVQLAIDMQPSEEKIFPLNEASTLSGDSILTVYDERRKVQLIRGAPFGDRPKTMIAANQQSPSQPADQTIPESAAESDPAALQWTEGFLGDDDEPANSTDTANPRRQKQLRNVTVPYVGELEGGPSPAVGGNPPDIPK
jgi:hypothetical protein